MHSETPQVIGTLLAVPPAPPWFVERDALAGVLATAAGSRLCFVRAPAGYGKTTLVADWARRTRAAGGRVSWLSLGELHDDPRTLLRYVVAALRTSWGPIGEATLTLLNTNLPVGASSLVTTLVNEMAALSETTWLVLDDVHGLRHADALQVLQELLQHAPAQLHVVMTSREAPGFPVARMRQQGQLVEIGMRELAFSADEAARLLQKENLPLASGDADALARHTGGWAAGLRLAAISMREQRSTAGFIRSFAGDQSAVSAFLQEDVLSRQPAVLQQFLLGAGVLDELSAPMCDEVLERGDSRALLEQALARGLFLIPVDGAGERFRFHRMFGEFLRQRALRDDPGLVRRIAARASDWCDRHGDTYAAVEYALRADEPERAGELLDSCSERIFAAGQLEVLERLAGRLPPGVIERCPRFALDLVWIHTLRWQITPARRLMRRVKAGLQARAAAGEAITPSLHEKLLHREIMIALLHDRLEEAEALRSRWPLLTTGENDYFEGSAETADLLARRERLDVRYVLAAAPRVRRLFQNAGTEFGTVWFDSVCAPAYLLSGNAERAAQVLRGAIDTAVRVTGPDSALVAMPSLLLAQVCYLRNDLAQARALIHQWLAQADQIGFVDQLIAGFVCAARLADHAGEHAQALAMLDRGDDLAAAFGFERLALHLTAERLRQLCMQGQAGAAREILANSAVMHDHPLLPPDRQASVTRAVAVMTRAGLSRGSSEQAAATRVLRAWIASLESHGCVALVIRMRAVLADLLFAEGDARGAWRALRPAVEAAADSGLLRPLIDEATGSLATLRHAGDSGALAGDPLAPLVAALLDAPAGEPDIGRPGGVATGARMEALTPREHEVLCCVADGSSNKEIGQRLGMSEATVKWHLQHVYDKLAVHRRVGAVRRARTLGLIP